MDELARFNKARWEELAQAGVTFSRPLHNLDEAAARREVDPYGMLGDVRSKDVLCLAGGGGQQTIAFALLGANITVLDLSEMMLQRDRETAAHYGYTIRIEQGDMRDLSRFAGNSFDIVWHAWSLSFVPDPRQVFAEVARVLRPGGFYRMACANPFVVTISEESWNGAGYVLNQPYVDGELLLEDPDWTFEDESGTQRRIEAPREFCHTLNTLVNGLAEQGFVLLGTWEEPEGDAGATPGTWEHFIAIAPPWLSFWTLYRPDVLPLSGKG